MGTLSVHLGELAEALQELRRRMRHTARVEVARALGEALRDLTLAMICGPVRYGAPRNAFSSWDDPWRDPADDPWQSQGAYPEEVEPDDPEEGRQLILPAALVAGLGAGRWGYVRTRQPALAILIGLLAALAAHRGGPTMKALLHSWSTVNELLSFPGPDPRP